MRVQAAAILATAVAVSGIAVGAGTAAAGGQLVGDARSAAAGDFDGNGIDDLAVGVPWEDIGGKNSAGAVNVIYGRPAGLAAEGDQVWHASRPGIPGEAEGGDRFGFALATGDFDDDGFDDLAVGVPREDKECTAGRVNRYDREDIGAVVVIYGSEAGLTRSGSHDFRPKARCLNLTDGRNFGWALAAGDFDFNGFADLAVGAPGLDNSIGTKGGYVRVYSGGRNGLKGWSGHNKLNQSSPGMDDSVELGDRFGFALAAGELGFATGADDLAVAVIREDGGGAVQVLYGQPVAGFGGSQVQNQLLRQGEGGLSETAESSDRFGWALAVGDFGKGNPADSGNTADLAIGVPRETITDHRQGAVQVLYGGSYGVGGGPGTPVVDQLWYEGADGVGGDPAANDEFGRSLAAGDLNGASQADLVVGVPLDEVGGVADAGAAHVIYGGPVGLQATGSAATPAQLWDESMLGLDATDTDDHFGFALAIGRFGGSTAGTGASDLFASTPGEDFPDAADVGAGYVIYGRSPGGLFAEGAQFWHQDSPGIEGSAEKRDQFGGAELIRGGD